jgi:hypothetical protein
MKRLYSAIVVLIALAFTSASLKAGERVHHDLKVVLYPEESRLRVKDTITVPEDLLPELQFLLHEGLEPSSPTPGVRMVRETGKLGNIPLESFGVTLPTGQRTFTVKYSGKIHHSLEPYGKEHARGFRQTPGLISKDGVYLSGSSFWYPILGDGLVTFDLQVELPAGWNAVSQGGRTLHLRGGITTSVQWESPEPQEEIFMVAGQFTEYARPAGRVEAMVFLRTRDEDLAKKYLDATARYVAMYEKLIGPYPYTKFALVENFWETGFGMPSFTLLGPKVIRFPFILHSSYPHEILHSWWGNSVFPDYTKGNWAEGLTAYLSDHLLKEQRGSAVDYRQATLQKYADYVLSERDFALAQFRSRHSSSSEAVGYGKSLMFFHMLRLQLGDETFVQGLRDFYRKHRFQFASFDDLRKAFERISGAGLGGAFNRWVAQPGAPEIKVSGAKTEVDGDGYILTALLEQVQPVVTYSLRIPIAVAMEGQDQAYQTVAVMEEKRLALKVHVPARPLRLDVDPEFDLFRRLNRKEIPPALTGAFGAKKMLILLPSSTGDRLLQAYHKLSQSLRHSGPDEVEVRLDTQVGELPSDRAVTILGWENLFLREMVSALSGYDVTINKRSVRIGRTEIRRENGSIVLTARHPKNEELSLSWVASDLPEALPGLGRKLPHYHKYSYLGFEGREPANVAKGRWPVLDSPMTVFLPLKDGTISKVEMGALAHREPLAVLPPVFSEKRMMDAIRFLSSDELRGRGFGTEGLNRAGEFIAGKFQEAGLKPIGDLEGSYFQIWEGRGGDPERSVIMRNVVGVIPGGRDDDEAQSVVVGAHYDHIGLGWPDVRGGQGGRIHHGADDNASGVAVLIELARVFGKSLKPGRSVVFVAFTGEEAGRKGSKYYLANQRRYPPEQCIGMLNLDTVGRLGKKKLLVIGAGSAREWIHIFRGAGYVTGVDVEAVAEELDSSDQKSFHEVGVPAVQLSSGPHIDYHYPRDTADRIDPEGLVKVASVAKEVIEYLVRREEPMTATLKPGGAVEVTAKGGRRASLGTIPDFSFGGDGYRLSGVVPGSPAESCGLKEGDVIVRIGSDAVHNVRGLSAILNSLYPGDRISITFMREGSEMTVAAELVGK